MGNYLESFCCAIGIFANSHPPKTKHTRVVSGKTNRVMSDRPHLLFSILTIVIILLKISLIETNPGPVILTLSIEDQPHDSSDIISVISLLNTTSRERTCHTFWWWKEPQVIVDQNILHIPSIYRQKYEIRIRGGIKNPKKSDLGWLGLICLFFSQFLQILGGGWSTIIYFFKILGGKGREWSRRISQNLIFCNNKNWWHT